MQFTNKYLTSNHELVEGVILASVREQHGNGILNISNNESA